MPNGELSHDGQTLHHLPPDYRRGLISISVLALISFTTTSLLFLYLTYKLVAWHITVPSRQEDETSPPTTVLEHVVAPSRAHRRPTKSSQQETNDFRLGIDGLFTEQMPVSDDNSAPRNQVSASRRARSQPNQFLVLIYNLLLADMHQSLAFVLNVSWLAQDGIIVHSPICFAQGFFVSTGDLSSSMFIFSIAIHTYLSVVRGYQPPQKYLYMAVCAIWLFVYAISIIPILATRNGASAGGFFVLAGAWCWVNEEYENLRLVTHYLYIFMSLFSTSVLYLSIFFHLRRQPRRQQVSFYGNATNTPQLQLSHNPAFLIYPIIYVTCTLPLATGRIATMAGVDVPIPFFCFAGAIIAFNGFFDCLLFGTTRNSIIFASRHEVDMADTGLNTFAFLKTPLTRRYGNMVWIQGGAKPSDQNEATQQQWPWRRLKRTYETRYCSQHQSMSQLSLRGQAIQMDLVTSVTVERDHNTAYYDHHIRGKVSTGSSVDKSMDDGIGEDDSSLS